MPDFLQQQLKPKKGTIIQIPSDFEIYHKPLPIFESKVDALLHQSQPIVYESEDGAVVGTHQGAHFFTKGQRSDGEVSWTAPQTEKACILAACVCWQQQAKIGTFIKIYEVLMYS